MLTGKLFSKGYDYLGVIKPVNKAWGLKRKHDLIGE